MSEPDSYLLFGSDCDNALGGKDGGQKHGKDTVERKLDVSHGAKSCSTKYIGFSFFQVIFVDSL